jgi:methyl-accepting chemotaxis protein
MTPIEKIRTSFTTQLTLWVAGFVLVISGLVLFLLVRFSQGVIRDEAIDTTQQVLENTALRIDNTLRQTEMMARQEHRQQRVNRGRIERLIEENGYEAAVRQSLPSAQLFVTRRDSSQLSTYIAGDERGYRQMLYEGREICIFSQPIADRSFSLVVICPAEEIYGRYDDVQWFLLLRGLVGVLILLYILYAVIGRYLRPLHLLADAAQSIANGRLDTPIPDAHHEHEAGRLQNSLKKMQSSLAAYMDEMQQKQDALNRQNAELQDAYAEAQAYETLKMKVLSSMNDRIAAPVEQLYNATETVCHDYGSLTKPQMVALQTNIMQATETITNLLNQLMTEPNTEQP